MQQVYIGTTNYGKHYLSAPAATSWFRMVRDGCPAEGITDALRTQTEQEVLFRKHYTTNYQSSAKIDRRVWDGQVWYRAYKNAATKTPWPSAATPGSPQARHQWGLSLDLNGTTKAWVRANGHRYGWIKDLVGGEDWHMEYQANRDVVPISNPGTSTGTVPTAPDVTAPDPIESKEFFEMNDEEARLAFGNQSLYHERTQKMLTEGFGNLAQYGHNLTVLGQDIRAAVQVATDNAYSGAQISTRVLNAVTDPTRGLAVQAASLAAEVAALRALVASGDGTDVDVHAIAKAAAQESLNGLRQALEAVTTQP